MISKQELEADLRAYQEHLHTLQVQMRMVRQEASVAGVVDYLQRKVAQMAEAEPKGKTLSFPEAEDEASAGDVSVEEDLGKQQAKKGR